MGTSIWVSPSTKVPVTKYPDPAMILVVGTGIWVYPSTCPYGYDSYGLIPERVVTVTSATTMHTQTFQTPIGRFTFRNFSDDYFPIGITMATEGEISFMIASPEKALCDMLMVEHHIPSQSLSALEVFFEEDMRIELDDLKAMDRSIIKQCMEKGKKKQILANLLKLLER